jgi:hypothetical protein
VKACGHGPAETLAHAAAHVARLDPGQRPGGKIEPGSRSLLTHVAAVWLAERNVPQQPPPRADLIGPLPTRTQACYAELRALTGAFSCAGLVDHSLPSLGRRQSDLSS